MLNTQTLKAKAEPYGLPIASVDEIEIDAKSINRLRKENHSLQFIWVIKSCGSVLFPIGKGINPHFVTFAFDSAHQCFHIKGTEVNPIDDAQAADLASQFPFPVQSILTQESLITKVTTLLEQASIHSHVLADCPLSSDAPWTQWQRWFEDTNHPVMAAFMEHCIGHSKWLREYWNR
ncbi:hypothetical protein J4N45_10055 [Vibrio sp. SCSIO 43140]|uniref:hypothetical protein n=1 Tax=Vibrio sp. SCSIO 43140 TaxID=2819100 RepID=UPI0020755054|nr:hypothetical protein [Vibrio sp. SCSIO 43140]USD58872.1 hypothetical protein J4N45_10055 [Vibrio sp. SCSIO 43140]